MVRRVEYERDVISEIGKSVDVLGFFVIQGVTNDRDLVTLDFAKTEEQLGLFLASCPHEHKNGIEYYLVRELNIPHLLSTNDIDLRHSQIHEYYDVDGNIIEVFDVWMVNTELEFLRREDKLMYSGLDKEQASEYIYFENVDEPSPDAQDYRNYVKVPAGKKPFWYQRK